jgi:hypothetical protein
MPPPTITVFVIGPSRIESWFPCTTFRAPTWASGIKSLKPINIIGQIALRALYCSEHPIALAGGWKCSLLPFTHWNQAWQGDEELQN